jgi:hypothetical protein
MKRFGFMFVVLAACGGSGGDDGGGPDGGGNEPLVEGIPASEFYGKFAYQQTNTGFDGAAAFPTNAAGNDAFVVDAFMMPGNAVQLFYAEGEGEVSPTGFSINVQETTKKKRTGTWRVVGAELDLGGFLRCTGMTLNNSPALRCTLQQAIVTAEAQGHAGTFRKMLGAHSPDDSEYASYTP